MPTDAKAVIVTGAASGIGAATVAELARRGARVLAVDLAMKAEQLPAWESGQVIPHEADVSDAAAVEGMVGAAVRQFGRLNSIFNNAGIFGSQAMVTDYPDDVFDRVFSVNVRGVYLGMKYAIPALRETGGGAILNTASTGALMAVPGASAYVASKHAVLGLTRSAALELAREHITVNALCPGPTYTPMIAGPIDEIHSEEERRALLDRVNAMGRLGRPQEIAEVAAWILLDAPEYLTGAPITVDGGLTAT